MFNRRIQNQHHNRRVLASCVPVTLCMYIFLPALLAETSRSLLNHAREAYRAGRLDKAIEYADQAIEKAEVNSETELLAQMRLARSMIYDAARRWKDALEDYTYALEFFPQVAQIYNQRGAVYFKMGRIDDSIADFDKAVELDPSLDPYHWQRGISYYYTERLDECIGQFNRHRAVNPNDVENAFWHFLCKSQRDGVDAARKSLLPAGHDKRPPMMKIYAVLQNKAEVEDVFTLARKTTRPVAHKNTALFYAHLYMGLYLETLGNLKTAKFHINKAARDFRFEHYMGDVARVHAGRLQDNSP